MSLNEAILTFYNLHNFDDVVMDQFNLEGNFQSIHGPDSISQFDLTLLGKLVKNSNMTMQLEELF